MQFLDLTLPTPAENLALDEALLLEAEAGHGGEILRCWEYARPIVVLGAACRLADEVHEPACAKANIPILRRSSGGGTVLLGPGCLCFSVVLAFKRSPLLREIHSSYAFILERIRKSLALKDIECAGHSDLVLAGRKFSGNSQQRKRDYLLHHGTLLYSFDMAGLDGILKPPPRQPDYRRQRDHADFLTNLPLQANDLKARMRAAWQADQTRHRWPELRVRELVETKYAQSEWVRRR